MGCTVSKTDIQLGKVDPWIYTENGEQVTISEDDLQKKRNVPILLQPSYNRSFGKAKRVGKQKFGKNCKNVVPMF